MANTLLTDSIITKHALMILHQKLNFVGNITREYDKSFAKEGAKIGDSLRIRLPNQYTVRSGATLSAQDTVETSTTLQVATQKGVDVNFTSADLTLDMEIFSERILEPAMSVLAANIENDALSMRNDVYNLVDNDTAAISLKNVLQGRQSLNEALAPNTNRTALLTTGHTTDLVDALKGLFQDSSGIRQQYREGSMGRTGGFDFFENTLLNQHTTGTAAKTTGYLANDATAQTGASVTVDTGSTTFLEGDVVTFAGVNRVHPETKDDTGDLQQFVITADSGATATTLAVSPALVASGSTQNVTNGIANNAAVVKVGAGASELLSGSMVFQKGAFAFATADLVKPTGVDFCSRQVLDGISMRIVRDYDISNDKFPCRIDVLYGFKTLRPELACRIHADG